MRALSPDRLVAVCALALGVALCGCARHPERPGAAGWNLLLVTIDTLRADRVGAYGSTAGATPNLDAFAAQGVRFASATSHAPLTLPSHATILSGRLPTEHGLRNNGAGRLPEGVPTLATRAAAAGYRSGAFVGAFVLARRFGLDRGFDVYDDAVAAAAGGQRFDAERPADQVVDRALVWLRAEAATTSPFFLWVHLFDPHAPYDPPEPWAGRFPGRAYEGEIAFADEQIGRLREELRARGVAGRTVVAVAADHGESLGEHGELTHGLLVYEPTLRVPLLIVAPGVVPAGGVVAQPAGLADLAPTLAGLLGWPEFDVRSGGGRDLSRDLVAGREPPATDLYAETEYPTTFGWTGLAALRRGRWKAIVGRRSELFDLSADPGEARDRWALERRLGRELGDVVSAQRAAVPQLAAIAPSDAETRAGLAALGYAAPPAGSEASARGRDARDMVAAFRAFEEAHWDLEAGRAAAAVRRLLPLVAADPRNAVFRSEMGRARLRVGDHAEALALYREAVALAPADAQAWYNLGMACHERGRLAEAARALTEAARLDPDWADPWNGLGMIALRGADGRGAAAHFERATELDPRSVLSWNNLGNVRREMGDAAGAEAAYRRALEIAPDAGDPANGLGVLLVATGRAAEAIAWFDRALAARPTHLESLLNRAVALELTGARERAAEDYRRYLAAIRGDPRLVKQRQAIEARLGRLTAGAR